MLTGRLAHLVQSGILIKSEGKTDGRETRYHLTPKGRDLWPVILSLLVWSGKHLAGGNVVAARSRNTGCGASDSAVDAEGNVARAAEYSACAGQDISDEFGRALKRPLW